MDEMEEQDLWIPMKKSIIEKKIINNNINSKLMKKFYLLYSKIKMIIKNKMINKYTKLINIIDR